MSKNYFCSILLCFIFFISSPIILIGQEQPEFLKWFDNQVGIENTRLLNGSAYSDRHRTINSKNKLYQGSAQNGSVLYDGQWFPDLQMRYNIYDDVLIVQMESSMGVNIIQLVKEKVAKFSLSGANFINVSPTPSAPQVNGFYELLWEDKNFSVLKKHARSIFEKRDRQVSYFEFEPIEGHFAFLYKDQPHLLRSRNNLVNIFPQYKNEIQAYYRTNRSELRSGPEMFYVNLFRKLSQLEEDTAKLSLR